MAIATSTAVPVPAEEVTLSATSSLVHADDIVIHWEITSVPDESALELGTLFDAAGDYISTVTFDVAGAYGITACIYCQIYDHGQPGGETRQVFRDRQTTTIYVCDLLNLPVVTTLGHGATIQIGVCNATVRSAAFVSPTTEVGRLATLDTTALASLATIVDVAVTAIDDTLETSVEDLRANAERHRLHGSHAVADTVNVITLERPYSNRAARDVLNQIYDRLFAHMTSGTYHTADDMKNLPLCGKASNDAQATVLSAELRFRSYDRHRILTATPASHTAPGDTTNTLTAAKPLAATIRDFLAAIYDISASTPAGEQAGAAAAAQKFGFARAA